MPIAALPSSTAQAIGSTSILPDPCAVVKELIDNGLDADATSISVEISPNTLDIIKVKDNGHGIAPVDFSHLCKKAYTSKIQTLENLRNIGGKSLGFRGVALASAANMVDMLTVTTRTKNEIVASLFKYDSTGQLVSTEKASYAVGTSICLTGFLKNIPVRRQTTIKNASKTIAQLKKLLQAYAIARPSIRLSFKVLNCKNEKDNWTYAPSPTASIVDASRKVVGVEVTGQCICRSWPETADDESDAFIKLLAYLPKADADFSKVSNCGQYISVDGRPLSSARGTAKDIVRLYKSHIRSAAKADGNSSLSDPFLSLHILCSKVAYDANVEPAKDDVLFAERDELIKLLEDLFKSTYEESKRTPRTTDPQPTSVNGFNILLRQPAAQELISPPATNQLPTVTDFSTPTIDLEETPQANVSSAQENEEEPDIENSDTVFNDNSANPWSITKTHFFHQSPKTSRPTQLTTPTRQSFGRRSIARRDAEATQSSPVNIPSPFSLQSSPENSGPSSHRYSSGSTRGARGSNSFTRASRERDRERYGNGSLDTWFVRSTRKGPSYQLRREHSIDRFETESVMLDNLDADDIADQSSNTPSEPPPPNKPHRSQNLVDSSRQRLPQRNVESVDVELLEKRQEFPVMEAWSSRLHQASQSQTDVSSNSDTDKALDFERRKREANIAHRKQLLHNQKQYLSTPASSQPASRSPHHNRYLAAKAALSQYSQQSQPDVQQLSSNDDLSMKENDPRVYLMRHQSEIQTSRTGDAKNKMKRIPTNRLPLEKIPNGFDMRNLCLSLDMPSPLSNLAKPWRHIAEIDFYISGRNEDTDYRSFDTVDNPDLPEICNVWKSTVMKLIKENYRLKEVDLYNAAGGSDEARIENIDIYAAIQSTLLK